MNPSYGRALKDAPPEWAGTIAVVALVGVIVFPADQRYWLPGTRRIQVGRSDLTGRYEFRGLPPDTYQLAVDSAGLFDDAWEPAVLVQLSQSARRIELGPGQALNQDLTTR
jgi:hypothetical protein